MSLTRTTNRHRGLPTPDVTIAKRLAAQMWGSPVQRQITLADGIWLFDTPGHGGVIVDLNKYPTYNILKKFEHTVYISARSTYYYPDEQHFAAFEEDCNAAVIEWLFPYIGRRLMPHYTNTEGKTFEEWEMARLINAKGSLEKYNPEVLKLYPKYGPLTKPTKK